MEVLSSARTFAPRTGETPVGKAFTTAKEKARLSGLNNQK